MADLIPRTDEPWEREAIEFARTLVGLSERDAHAAAERRGFTMRTVGRHGTFVGYRANCVRGRINVMLDGGLVGSIWSVG